MIQGIDLPAPVEAVWLFGSFARHTPKVHSDLDLLVLTDDGATPPEPAFLADVFHLPQLPEVSHYTRGGIVRISRPPSLFAWHLQLEGNPLFERTDWLRYELQSLEPYTSHLDDLDVLRRLHQDVCRSIGKDQKSLVFDAGVLGIIGRNAALLLTHFDGKPDFSAEAPLRALDHPNVRLPITENGYAMLYRSRMAMERGGSAPVLSCNAIQQLSYRFGMWLGCLRQYFSGRM